MFTLTFQDQSQSWDQTRPSKEVGLGITQFNNRNIEFLYPNAHKCHQKYISILLCDPQINIKYLPANIY